MHHPFLEIRSCNSGHTSQWGFHTKLAYFQNALGIDLPVAAQFHNFFVTGTLALLDAERLCVAADVAGAMSLEALKGSSTTMHSIVQDSIDNSLASIERLLDVYDVKSKPGR